MRFAPNHKTVSFCRLFCDTHRLAFGERCAVSDAYIISIVLYRSVLLLQKCQHSYVQHTVWEISIQLRFISRAFVWETSIFDLSCISCVHEQNGKIKPTTEWWNEMKWNWIHGVIKPPNLCIKWEAKWMWWSVWNGCFGKVDSDNKVMKCLLETISK